MSFFSFCVMPDNLLQSVISKSHHEFSLTLYDDFKDALKEAYKHSAHILVVVKAYHQIQLFSFTRQKGIGDLISTIELKNQP